MKTITLEEHFVTHSFLQATGAERASAPPRMQQIQAQLLDLGAGRIAAMDEGGVDLQVLSLAALDIQKIDAASGTSLMRDVNDELAAAVKLYPDRFAGFATLSLWEPDEAAKELERCVTRHGFKGANLNGTTGGRFMDEPRFLPVFEAAQQLGVPIYLHPAEPPETVMDAYYTGLSNDPTGEAAHLLSIAGWGWHAENGLHTLRLIVSGLFDRLPDLQVIIGHMGEGLPYALARSNAVLSSVMKHLPLSVAEYFHRNIHVTTSGYFTKPPLACALEVVGIERMMYSVDYPFSPMTRGKEYLDSLDLTEEEMARFTHRNAAALLRL
jgi:predicted TIM-barrel fold metal-dependent hydrolase